MVGRGIIDETYIRQMDVEQLRRELVDALEFQFSLLDALRTLPEFPPPFVLHMLGEAASWPKHHEIGKRHSIGLGSDVIPPVTECEGGAGLWSVIRVALVQSNE